MAKQTGLGDNCYVSGYDLSGDIGSLSRIGGSAAYLDVTGIDKSAMERRLGPRDGYIDFTAFFNDAAGQEHVALSTLPTADRIVTYHRSTVLGAPGAALMAKQINYDPTRPQDGSFTEAVQTVANGFGLEWGDQLTAGKRSDTTATAGTSVDAGASSAFGLQAYLQVFSFTGTSITIAIQESSDDGGGDAFTNVTDGVFTAVTSAPDSERIATSNSQTVEQYLRINTTGTFSECTFAVVVVRNLSTVNF
jgi:hypothetical protein